MSLLVIQLPPRDRLGSRGGAADSASGHRLPTEWPYTYSADGRVPGASGHAPAALLPKADQCVLVLADADVSWHLVDVPKAPAGKLRDALAGVMEESLLEESEALHFALAADAGPSPTAPDWLPPWPRSKQPARASSGSCPRWRHQGWSVLALEAKSRRPVAGSAPTSTGAPPLKTLARLTTPSLGSACRAPLAPAWCAWAGVWPGPGWQRMLSMKCNGPAPLLLRRRPSTGWAMPYP